MARRASSSLKPRWVIGSVLLIIAALAGGQYLFKSAGDPYRTIPPFETKAYLENSNSLRGNVYKVTGTISNSLAWSPTVGRLFSLEINSGDEMLPVLIPAKFNHVNIQKGQQFQFQIEVGEKGILTAIDLVKV